VGVGEEVSRSRSYVQLWLQGHWSGPPGMPGPISAWPTSSTAAQAAVAAAPCPALRVEAKPPALAVVTSALLAVRKASCCKGKVVERPA